MAKLYYESSAIKNDSAQDSLQHWKYIRREKVGDKWKYFYKDDATTDRERVAKQKQKDAKKAATKQAIKNKVLEVKTNVAEVKENVGEKVKEAKIKVKAKNLNKMTMEEWNEKHPVTDRSVVANQKKFDAAKAKERAEAKEQANKTTNRNSYVTRNKVGKEILDKALAKDARERVATDKAKGKIAEIRKEREAAEKQQKESESKAKAAERQKQWEQNVIESMANRKNENLNKKKAAYNEAKAKRDAEADAMRKAVKEKGSEFAKKFLENRKTEAERKREEIKRKRKR